MKRLVVAPATLLLLPEYASREDPIADLRQAVREAAPAGTIVACPDATRSSTAVDIAEPIGIRVGRTLVESPQDEVVLPAPVDTDGDVLLLADGSARRQEEGGPGVFDTRAEDFDATIAAALAGGDTAALAGLDASLGAELLAAGVPGFRWLGTLPAPGRARLLVDEAPYGVGWFVAVWEW